MLFFVLRRLATRIFFPVSLFSIGLVCCCLLLFHHKAGRRCRRIGRIVMLALVVFWVMVCYTGSFWLKLWTRQYLPLDLNTLRGGSHYVVAVHGHEFIPDEEIPAEHRFSGMMLLRLGEAARIARHMDRRGLDYEIAVSTYVADGGEERVREAVRAYFENAGVRPGRLSLVSDAVNSRAEVKRFLKYPGTVILVSNAFHVPRLMMLSRRFGAEAIAAPADSLNCTDGPALFSNIYPDSRNLDAFERLVYELMGCAEVKFF